MLLPKLLLLFLSALASLPLLLRAGAAFGGPAKMALEDVNISGAEWGAAIPGVYGVGYMFPTATELDYFSSKGMIVIRVPFMWERMQPAANGPLDPTYLGRLDQVVSGAAASRWDLA